MRKFTWRDGFTKRYVIHTKTSLNLWSKFNQNDMMPDGTKFQARDWVLYYVQLKGSTLKAWKAPDEFQLTCAETLPVPPDTEDWSFVIDPNESEMKMVQEEMQQKIEPLVQNINDAGCEWVGIFAKGCVFALWKSAKLIT